MLHGSRVCVMSGLCVRAMHVLCTAVVCVSCQLVLRFASRGVRGWWWWLVGCGGLVLGVLGFWGVGSFTLFLEA